MVWPQQCLLWINRAWRSKPPSVQPFRVGFFWEGIQDQDLKACPKFSGRFAMKRENSTKQKQGICIFNLWSFTTRYRVTPNLAGKYPWAWPNVKKSKELQDYEMRHERPSVPSQKGTGFGAWKTGQLSIAKPSRVTNLLFSDSRE